MPKRPVKVYLCGPISNRTDDEAIGWRKEQSTYLTEIDYAVGKSKRTQADMRRW